METRLPGFEKPQSDTEEPVYTCQVCDKPGTSWGKPGTLAGCCPYIRLMEGKIRTIYFGFIHEECRQEHWKKEIEKAANNGWLVPLGDGKYEVAPEYR